MRAHLVLHELGDERPYVCQVTGCGKAFRSEKTLRSHQIVHSEEKGFACTYPNCGRTFNRVDNMRAHVLGVHEGKQTRKKRNDTDRIPTATTKTKVRCGARQTIESRRAQKFKRRRHRDSPEPTSDDSDSGNYPQDEYIVSGNFDHHPTASTSFSSRNSYQTRDQALSSSTLPTPSYLSHFSSSSYYYNGMMS